MEAKSDPDNDTSPPTQAEENSSSLGNSSPLDDDTYKILLESLKKNREGKLLLSDSCWTSSRENATL